MWNSNRSAPVHPVRAILAALGLAIALVSGAANPAAAATRTHGLSTFGDLKYPAGFKHFDYVRPDAPKGGRLTTNGGPTFDTFHAWIVKGSKADGLPLLFDSLMARASDEPDALYGLVASAAEIADDRKSVTFWLRPEAKFADGSALTAADVVFSLETLKEKGSPGISLQLRDVTKVEAIDAHTVKYTFGNALVRDLPLVVASMPILSKAWYATRVFEQTTLEPPLGSGPYTLASFETPKFVMYKRRADYWAKDLPVNVGRWNFDEIRYDSFRDRAIGLEALKAGQIDLREEFIARDWSTAYEFPAVREGRVVKVTLEDKSPSGAQGFFLNMRRPKFADPRVRRALDLAFDFEWMNKNIFYGLYTRTQSFFENSDLKAAGLPTPEEVALLEPFRAKLSPAVFGEPYAAPPTDGSGMNRDNLKVAARLLDEAGWSMKDGKRVDAKGEAFTIEFLFEDASFLRVTTPFEKNLRLLGLDVTQRQVDAAQLEERTKKYEFDVLMQRYVMGPTPGVELKNYWSSEAAQMAGSRNLAGIANPVIDALIERVVLAKSRDELKMAARALDRVMRAEHVWVPNWYKAAHNIAMWNKFGRPETKPRYDRGVTDTWWYDAAKAGKLMSN